jgi:hypothetical protein
MVEEHSARKKLVANVRNELFERGDLHQRYFDSVAHNQVRLSFVVSCSRGQRGFRV